MKLATKTLAGRVIELVRRADLRDAARVQANDAVGQRHRLGLVMRDEDRGHAERLVQQLDLGPDLHAQLGIEIGQRLVEQEELRLPGQRPAHGHALALAARKRLRLAVEVGLELQERRRSRATRVARSARRHAVHPQAKADVRRHRHVRIERVVLKHHREVALACAEIVDDPPPIDTVPSVMSSSPAIMRRMVDLPQPEGPTSTTNSPSAISRSMPWTTAMLAVGLRQPLQGDVGQVHSFRLPKWPTNREAMVAR